MIRTSFLITTTVFWLAMMSMLVHREFFQISAVQAPYDVLPIHNLILREEYRGVYIGSELIGWTLNVLENMTEDETVDYELRHNTYLSFRFLGEEREMLVRGKAFLNKRLELEKFQIKVSSGEYWTEMTGQIAKENLNLVVEGKEGEPARKILPLKGGPVFFSESLPFLWTPENLRTGRQGRLRLWNPLSLTLEEITFRVGQRETLLHEGTEHEVFVVTLAMDEIETRAWITPEGVVLKQENMTGLITLKEPAWRIFDTMREKRDRLPDLPHLYSIPSNRPLENPEALRMLAVRVSDGREDKYLQLERRPLEAYPDYALTQAAGNPELASFLESDTWIQADDGDIRKQAEEIAGDAATVKEAASRLLEWTHTHISPTPTVSIPSARQVLDVLKGDCNEFTVLYTALARSLGIATRMVTGLVYRDERFFYHAWPEVYSGEWLPVDPTFGQMPADVTHIPLLIGGLEDQIQFMNRILKLHVVIVDAQSSTA